MKQLSSEIYVITHDQLARFWDSDTYHNVGVGIKWTLILHLSYGVDSQRYSSSKENGEFGNYYKSRRIKDG